MKKFIIFLIIVIIIGTGAYFYMKPENNLVENKLNEIETFYAEKETWENLDSMPLGGIAGIYKTGYAFFDIDLDNKKELAVQLGGGSLLNCFTKFYEYENGEIKEKEFFDETYSLSINELRKFVDIKNNEVMYINKYRLKIEPTKYITCYDKISKVDKELKVQNLFRIEESYDENSEATYTYYSNDQKLDFITYYEEYEKFFSLLKEELLVTNFISSEDWKNMNDSQQKVALEKSYSKEDYKYVYQIKNEVISKEISGDAIKTYDIVLSEDIYGETLKEYLEITKTSEVTAKVMTDGETFVEIIPTPDFLNNHTYYFKDGKKVAYVVEFVGIGGEAEYYLRNGELVFINKAGIEESMIFTPEDVTKMLTRANVVYDKYIK